MFAEKMTKEEFDAVVDAPLSASEANMCSTIVRRLFGLPGENEMSRVTTGMTLREVTERVNRLQREQERGIGFHMATALNYVKAYESLRRIPMLRENLEMPFTIPCYMESQTLDAAGMALLADRVKYYTTETWAVPVGTNVSMILQNMVYRDREFFILNGKHRFSQDVLRQIAQYAVDLLEKQLRTPTPIEYLLNVTITPK